jgi:N-acetylglucosaminyldiphosphoundecaprenol N-acetyl-beta-D-mannosaminyltransferase
VMISGENVCRFLRLEFKSLTCQSLTSIVDGNLVNGKSIHFVAASTVIAVFEDSLLISKLNSNILVADSSPLKRYLNLKYSGFTGIRGTDYMREFLASGSRKYFLIGSTEQTTISLISAIGSVNSNASCVGTINPDFKESFESDIPAWVEAILESKARSVWVGMGSPKQDVIALALAERLEIPVFSVGAAFDFVAGTQMEAPRALQLLSLEWLFRLLSEPRRLWRRYLFGNFTFLRLIVKDIQDFLGKKS